MLSPQPQRTMIETDRAGKNLPVQLARIRYATIGASHLLVCLYLWFLSSDSTRAETVCFGSARHSRQLGWP